MYVFWLWTCMALFLCALFSPEALQAVYNTDFSIGIWHMKPVHPWFNFAEVNGVILGMNLTLYVARERSELEPWVLKPGRSGGLICIPGSEPAPLALLRFDSENFLFPVSVWFWLNYKHSWSHKSCAEVLVRISHCWTLTLSLILLQSLDQAQFWRRAKHHL